MNVKYLKQLLLIMILTVASVKVLSAERILATVNGAPILENQVKSALGKKPDTPSNRRAALETIIDDYVVKQAISKVGKNVSYADVDLIIESLAYENDLTLGQLLDVLDYQGIDYDTYRLDIANQILTNEVRNQSIEKGLDVTREQVDALGDYLRQKAKERGTDKQVLAKQYEVRHILLKTNPLLNDAQAKAELNQIRADILAQKITFADAAKQYSKDYLSGANGGVLDFAFPDIYAEPFQKAITKTKKGTISAPFKTEFGWHIVEVLDTREEDRTSDSYREKAYKILIDNQVQGLSENWVGVLRKLAEIKYYN